ncbi:Asp23/Gls24 family envelope stress response protein [Actinomadura roseirufa]|uniref:Asp23/Gls24 family envelope stress response protein n=1 Tax=Actinomadura roseirufa TaxID=2094049 RepID=UPI001040F9A1|nr:Asp23/Gls24 family envelope stress response protein [Actinomadura roseirufa]
MTEPDKGHAGKGGEPPREVGSVPFFPSPPGRLAPAPPPVVPLSAPAPPPAAAPRVPSPHAPVTPAMPLQGGRAAGESPPDLGVPPGPASAGELPGTPPDGTRDRPGPVAPGAASPVVDGRITIEDEVIEKIAALAALEVRGVVMLTGRPDPAARPGPDARLAGRLGGPPEDADPVAGRGATGVRLHRHDDDVTLDLAIAVEYGSVIMEVARVVKANVARVTGVMLGIRVAAVNVSVEDVRRPPVRP